MRFSYSAPSLTASCGVPLLAGVACPRLPDVDPLRIGVLGTARISTTALLGPAASVPEVTVTAVAARDRSGAGLYPGALGHLVAVRHRSVVADERGGGDTTYTEQLRAFAGAVVTGATVPTSAPLSTAEHAVTTMRLIDDAYAAAGLLPR
jgi:predicted dehydrogenase